MAKNYVCNGAKIECKLCTKPEGTLKVTSNEIKIQDKLFATEGDKEKINLVFEGNCKKSWMQASPCVSVIKPEKWQGVADLIVQDQKALLENSTIMCAYGGVPIKITDHLQINEIGSLQPVAGPFLDPIFEPTIISLEWKSNKEAKDKNKTFDFPNEVIEETTAGEKIWLEACTFGMLPGETVTFEIIEKENPKTILLHSTGYIDTEGNTRIELQSEDDIDIAKQTLCATVTYFDQKKDANIIITPKLPKLQGEIIFVNGYLSDPEHNTESHYNALTHKNPDNPNSGAKKGENTDEKDRTHPEDIDTAQEKRDRDNAPKKSRKEKIKDFLNNPLKGFAFTPDEKYYDYWNLLANEYLGTETYAQYFNAEEHIHYINGSHGLGSNGAHRIDHGISLGYTWAKQVYTLLESKDVEEFKDEIPLVEQYSPKYKPITIVGHSQGACMSAGVALGVIKYAADMGYSKIPINIIFLGVHQPKGLFGKEYHHLIDTKVNRYEVNYTFFNLLGKNEDFGDKFLNSLSQIFSDKYKKLYNNRGLFEHIQEISNWNTYKTRAVQFTFTNDRGDLVLRDGDIPKIPSACNPKQDTTLFSAEYYTALPSEINNQNKEIIDLTKHGAKGGFIVLPKYIANKRYDFKALDDVKHSTKEQQKLGVEWGDYKIVAIRWGKAMYNYKTLKKQFKTETGITYEYTNKVVEEYSHAKQKRSNWFKDKNPFEDELTEQEKQELEQRKKDLNLEIQVTDAFETALKKYAALQNADLYAHFSPVAMIHHKKIVEDFPNDALGNESIWKRIQNLGKDMFYRVEYDSNPEIVAEMTEQQKRKKEKKDVEGKLANKLIDTSIANTDYIKNVIEAYVHKNQKVENKLYKEEKDEK